MIASIVQTLGPEWTVRIALMAFTIGWLLTAAAYCIYFERKVSAWIQDRIGPNRVGPKGLLQSLADGGKMLLKEEYVPAGVEKPLFLLAPTIAFIPAMITFAVIPWGGKLKLAGETVLVQVASVDIGVLYILGVAGVAVYGAVIAGWASNNKYSFPGGMRSTAMMISYEIPMGLAILTAVMTAGHLRLEDMVQYQIEHGWLILAHPLAFIILLTCIFAENNRLPFDLAEAEQELVGGFHTEYSALKFGLFYLGEYCHMMIGSAMIIALYLGGWHLPFGLSLPDNHSIWAVMWRMFIYWFKVGIFIFVFMWVRWTLPRFRYDQLMRLTWQGFLPIMMGLVLITGLLLAFGLSKWWQLLVANVVVAAIAYWVVELRPGRVTGRQANLPDLMVVKS